MGVRACVGVRRAPSAVGGWGGVASVGLPSK